MSSMPGPRTNPTVKPLANSSHQNLRKWHISLGPVSMALLIGLMTACLASSFYLGFFSGQRIGLETALNNNLSTTIRLPISAAPEGLQDDLAVEVYDRLDDDLSQAEPDPLQLKLADTTTQNKRALDKVETSQNGSNQEAVNTDKTSAKVASATDVNAAHLNAVQEALARTEPKSGDIKEPLAKASISNTLLDAKAPSKAQKDESQKGSGIEIISMGTSGSQKDKTTLGSLIKEKEQSKKEQSKTASKVGELEKQQHLGQQAQKGTVKLQQASSVTKKIATPNKGWFAQVAAPDTKPEAEALAQKLRNAGFAVAIENATVRGQLYYRVLVGPESNRAQAERMIAQLKRENFLKTDPFLRLLK